MEPKFSSYVVSGWAIAHALECARVRAAQLSPDRLHAVRFSTGAWATVGADHLRVYAEGITSWDNSTMEHYIETNAVEAFGPLCMVYSKFPMREDRYTVLLACRRLDSVSFQRVVAAIQHDHLLTYRWADPAPTRAGRDWRDAIK